MKIPKWTKHDLEVSSGLGYKFVPCTDAKEVETVYEVLSSNNRCAQVGYAVNRDKVDVFFVATKKKVKRGVKIG